MCIPGKAITGSGFNCGKVLGKTDLLCHSKMKLPFISFFGRSGMHWVFLLIVFGRQLQAQPPADVLRKQLGIPVFDSLLLLNPVQRVNLLDKIKAQMAVIKPDSAGLSPLILQMREFAEDQDSRDPDLMADLLEYYNRRIWSSEKGAFRQQIACLSRLHIKAKKENAEWFFIEVDMDLANAYVAQRFNYESGVFLQRDLAGMAEKTADSLCPRKQAVLFNLGVSYLVFNDPKNAVWYLKRALSVKPPKGMFDNRVSILNHLGLAYRDLNQLDNSDSCFNENLKIVEGAYVGITKGNLGENQYLRRKYDAALPLLQADADMALELNDYHLASNALMLMGDIYSRKGNYLKADSILSIGLRLLRNTNSFPKRKKGFSIMERFYIHTHRYSLAALFQDSVLYVSDSLERFYNQSKVSSAEAGFEFQNLREKTQEELTALKLSRQKRTGLAIIFFLLAVIVYLFLQRRLSSARLRESNLNLLQKSTEEELQASRKELEQYVAQLSAVPVDSVDWHNSNLHTGLQYNKFLELFSRSFPGFIDRLNEAFPILTEAEIRYCCLERLNMNVKEKASILGINENSVNKTKGRLRSKLGLEKDASIHFFLVKI